MLRIWSIARNFAMRYPGVSTAPRPFLEPVRLRIAPRPSQRHRDPL